MLRKIVFACATALPFSWLMLASASAQVAPAPIDMTGPILDENGQPVKDPTGRSEAEVKDDPRCEKCPTVSVAVTVARALFSTFKDEVDLPADRKWSRAALAMRIKAEPKGVMLTAEEIVEIKKVVGKAYSGLAIAQVYPLLGAKTAPELK